MHTRQFSILQLQYIATFCLLSVRFEQVKPNTESRSGITFHRGFSQWFTVKQKVPDFKIYC